MPNSNPPLLRLTPLMPLVCQSAVARRYEAQSMDLPVDLPVRLLVDRPVVAGYPEALHPCARATVSSPRHVFRRHVSPCRLFVLDGGRKGS